MRPTTFLGASGSHVDRLHWSSVRRRKRPRAALFSRDLARPFALLNGLSNSKARMKRSVDRLSGSLRTRRPSAHRGGRQLKGSVRVVSKPPAPLYPTDQMKPWSSDVGREERKQAFAIPGIHHLKPNELLSLVQFISRAVPIPADHLIFSASKHLESSTFCHFGLP